MHDKKLSYIEEIDKMLDDEIIDAIKDFKNNPTIKNLDIYTALMKADHYTDAWLERFDNAQDSKRTPNMPPR